MHRTACQERGYEVLVEQLTDRMNNPGYASAGLEATRLGADDVVKAEQAVARQFYEMLQRKLATRP